MSATLDERLAELPFYHHNHGPMASGSIVVHADYTTTGVVKAIRATWMHGDIAGVTMELIEDSDAAFIFWSADYRHLFIGQYRTLPVALIGSTHPYLLVQRIDDNEGPDT